MVIELGRPWFSQCSASMCTVATGTWTSSFGWPYPWFWSAGTVAWLLKLADFLLSDARSQMIVATFVSFPAEWRRAWFHLAATQVIRTWSTPECEDRRSTPHRCDEGWQRLGRTDPRS